MNPKVKTGLTFVFGAFCGAVLSRRQYMINNPRYGPDGRPLRPPWAQRAYAKKYGTTPPPPPPPSTESAAVTPAKD